MASAAALSLGSRVGEQAHDVVLHADIDDDDVAAASRPPPAATYTAGRADFAHEVASSRSGSSAGASAPRPAVSSAVTAPIMTPPVRSLRVSARVSTPPRPGMPRLQIFVQRPAGAPVARLFAVLGTMNARTCMRDDSTSRGWCRSCPGSGRSSPAPAA